MTTTVKTTMAQISPAALIPANVAPVTQVALLSKSVARRTRIVQAASHLILIRSQQIRCLAAGTDITVMDGMSALRE